MSRRIALLIGNTDYEDRGLAKLTSPEMDMRELAGLLQDPQIGAFDEVTPLFNHPFADVYPAIAEFFADKQREDTLLLYFSGHGVLDDQGRLYLALKNTRLNRLSGTALPSHFLKDEMDRSRSKRQILLLDCCHSGAFGKGSKGAVGAQALTADTFAGQGHERVVLTATDKTEMAWEGDQIVDKEMEMSLFTHYVVEGLRTGAADVDSDGAVTPNELYNYVFDRVVEATHKQKPHCFVYDRGGELHLARNPRPKPAQLSAQLQEALNSPYVSTREEALKELVRLLNGSDRGRSAAAQAALQHMADHDDSRRIAGAAVMTLAAFTGQPPAQAPLPTPMPRPPVENDPTATSPRLPVDRERFAAEEASREAYLKQRAEAANAAKHQAERQRQEEAARVEREQMASQQPAPHSPRIPVDRERFAAEEASREAYLKQRAEAASAAKQKAERQRQEDAARQESVRLASQKAAAEQQARAQAQVASLPAAAPMPPNPIRPASQSGLLRLIGPIALTSLGWAIAMAVTIPALANVSISFFLGEQDGTVFVQALFGGLIGGAFTGAALRANRPSVPVWLVGFIAVTWMLAQLLFMAAVVIDPTGPALGITVMVVVWVIAGGITTLVGLLTLGLDRPPLLKGLIILVISGAAWAMALPGGTAASLPILFLFGEANSAILVVVGFVLGAVAGAIAGAVMFWLLRWAASKRA
jgi:hypothetical protein